MTEFAMVLDNVQHTYGNGTTVLHDISINVRKGEFLTLLGPSGCGKTTLLRIIAGFTEPSRGRVLLDGDDVTRTPPHRRKVNLVFQRITLFPHLNVFENVAFAMRLAGKSRPEISKRVEECLAMVRLEGFAGRNVAELSGGQAQRVSLARALANRPEVLLLDEPLSALDLKVRLELEGELRRLHRDEGLTAIYVTHDQREALALSDRIALFNHGRIDQLAPPDEVYRMPATEFAARFVGDANVVPCQVEASDNEQVRVSVGDFSYLVSSTRYVPGPMRLVVRQEDIAVSAAKKSPEGEGLRAKVVDIDYRGSGYTLKLSIDNLALYMNAEVPSAPGLSLSVGDHVDITWRAEAAWPLASN